MKRNNFDTSNPAITHTPIPLHGGGFQGVPSYAGPDEWPGMSFQAHWAAPGSGAKPNDPSQGLINPGTCHVHLEWALPIYGEITGPITIPFRMVAFQLKGYFQFNSGPMVSNVIYDVPQDLPWHHFPGDPLGEVSVTGRFTFDPFIGDTGPNIHMAAPNGWTNFMATVLGVLDNGDIVSAQGMAPIFTKLGDAVYNPDWLPNTSSGNGITSVPDGGSAKWGSQIAEVRNDFLPLLGPIDTIWPIPHIQGYMYGGTIGFDGTFQMRKDMDLHHGNLGVLLPGAPPTGSGPGFLDPQFIGQGTHKIALVWQTNTGPTGIPGQAIPNEVATALLVFTVEVGDVPPVETCQDPSALNFGGPLPCQYAPPKPVDVPFNPNFFETPEHDFKIVNPDTGTTKII